jgi:hypothetical protein
MPQQEMARARQFNANQLVAGARRMSEASTEAIDSHNRTHRQRGLVRTPKGAPRRGGRVKGTPNKVNSDIKQMVVEALSRAGGVKYLVQCAHKQPVAFLGPVGRVLPLTIAGKGEDGAIPISFEWAPAAVAKDAGDNSKLTIDAVTEPVREALDDAVELLEEAAAA